MFISKLLYINNEHNLTSINKYILGWYLGYFYHTQWKTKSCIAMIFFNIVYYLPPPIWLHIFTLCIKLKFVYISIWIFTLVITVYKCCKLYKKYIHIYVYIYISIYIYIYNEKRIKYMLNTHKTLIYMKINNIKILDTEIQISTDILFIHKHYYKWTIH